jgi:hypothetical protein
MVSPHNLAAHEMRSLRVAAQQRDDRRVMSFAEWCDLNNISVWTGRRLIKAGLGPKILQLSPRRIGISVAANRAWQAARERA